MENHLTDMVRVGIVTAVDGDSRRARVHFPDRKLTSGWLYLLNAPPTVKEQAVKEHPAGEHTVTAWMPAVNDRVLCLYIPVFGGDGFVLGGL